MHPGHHPDERPDGEAGRLRFLAAVRRFLLFGLLWLMLAEGEAKSLLIGVPVSLLATIVSLWLSPSRSWDWRLGAIPGFLAVFAYYSLRGGLDVASRALRPSLPLNPGLLNYTLRLSPGTARVFFANVVSLLPGTISADLRGDTVLVHVLAQHLSVRGQLERLEMVVGRLFASPIVRSQEERRQT